MKPFKHKFITRVMTIALILFGISAFAVSGVFAQMIGATEVDGNSDIQVTARVQGCGDGVAQTGLGEQCDGTDLNGQDCSDLGFTGGTLSCRPSCIFDVTSCTNNTGSGGSGGSGSRVRGDDDNDDELDPGISTYTIQFNGESDPNDIILILNDGQFFTFGIADSNGNFNIIETTPELGDYSFTFIALSAEKGVSIPEYFNITLESEATVEIFDIDLDYQGEPTFDILIDTNTIDVPEEFTEIIEAVNPLFDVFVVNVIEDDSPVIPYLTLTFVGLLMLLLGRLFWWLLRPRTDKYIDYYDLSK
ncbi:MAG: hypothetical protein MRY57_03430 [Candidatus Pacebacteria bacterium]|nr:hypothetical protein [Candidatus Paceibacterota bacterium]